MKTALYPGSFDPFTIGHFDIATRAAKLFDRLIIGIGINQNKKSNYDISLRIEMIKTACKNFKNVEVYAYDGLLVDFVKEKEIDVVVRGIRNSKDVNDELDFYNTNILLDENINIVFIPAKPKYQGISSSAVNELIKWGSDLSAFVQPDVIELIEIFERSKRNAYIDD